MPPRILHNYKPRSVTEEIAKNLIEIALCDNPSAALRATIVIFDRVEGKPAKSIYLHHGNGDITIEYENGWQPPQVEVERACVKIRRDQRPRWVRKRDRRPDYKPRDWRVQEIKRQAGVIWLGE